MSGALGRYHFLSWARRGIGGAVGNADDGGLLPARAAVAVQLALNVNGAPGGSQPTPTNAELFGPGDVIGLDPRHVIRTEPRDGTVNYEPNYLCGIEFDGPDLPWLFTPAAANGARLRPWLSLVVLKADEFKPSPLAPDPLPAIVVGTLAALPALDDSWNWAHVQVSGDTPLGDAMTSAPGAVLSRLLCPRRLDPETAYTAFLVPAFEVGRLVGLGQDVSAVTDTAAAWTAATAAPLTLPVYFQFTFRTSDAGDFESLVRRLTPRILPAEIGTRPMDVSRPMHDIPSAGPPLGLEGALHSISTTPTAWSDPDKAAFQTRVQAFINQPSAPLDDPAHPIADDPVVAPPIYGRWHAAAQAVDRTVAGWVNELNLDPRDRAAAGMGTQVVQGETGALLASAWQQVDGVRAANQLLRQAQLSRAAMAQLFQQHFVAATPETALVRTAPLHARLMASPITIRATTRASRVPERMLSATFRRVTRPRRRLTTTPGAATRATPLLGRINSGELTFVPPAKPPGGMVSIEQLSDAQASPADRLWAALWPWLVALLLVLVVIGALLGGATAAALGAFAAAMLVSLRARVQAARTRIDASDKLRPSGFTPATVASLPARPDFEIAVAPAGAPPLTTPPTTTTTGGDSPAAAAFRGATSDLFTFFQAQPVDPPQAPALDLRALKTTLLTRLDPATTVPRRALARLARSPALTWQPPDPIEPIMAAPEFPQPMYAPLRDLSPQYVLPGAELVPADTMGLLVTNHAFIEGYMAGLNHEMARQLLFNGYPTDQRGSYFRQFWDVSGYVRQPSDPADPKALDELLKDIPPEHLWSRAAALGEHPNRTDVVKDNVVLLVRGELFRRYPNAIVYAGKARRDGATRVLDESDERYPLFRGALPDDMTFLGFNLSVDDARGGTADSPEGFFFVFQEQPSEPRFGLEPTERANPTTSWSDLAWTSFGGAEGGGGVFQVPGQGSNTRARTMQVSPWRLASQVFSLVLAGAPVPAALSSGVTPRRLAIHADADNPDDPANGWGVNSAQTAYILLRAPFRILVHADLMLPSK
ncbi:MAG TPA: hypothetical protein VGP07_10630 [Polyangia bacterium]|jgi:hypothetical protein